jgi:hypothetical protein
MKLFTIFLTSICMVLMCQAGQEHVGVFSNNAEGFQEVVLMIDEGGYAYFQGSVLSLIGKWNYDEKEQLMELTFFDPDSGEDKTIQLTFEKENRIYVSEYIDGKSSNNTRLEFKDTQIPEKAKNAFLKYPQWLSQAREHFQVMEDMREAKRRHQEKVERERPEYERHLEIIKENPSKILSDKYHVEDFGLYYRAFSDSLKNKENYFPEAVLIELLETLPEPHAGRTLIFNRQEISSETITRYYPIARDKWSKTTYVILQNIVKHPNTPIAVIRDLAGRKDVAVGAVHPAQRRLKELEKEGANKTE